MVILYRIVYILYVILLYCYSRGMTKMIADHSIGWMNSDYHQFSVFWVSLWVPGVLPLTQCFDVRVP